MKYGCEIFIFSAVHLNSAFQKRMNLSQFMPFSYLGFHSRPSKLVFKITVKNLVSIKNDIHYA